MDGQHLCPSTQPHADLCVLEGIMPVSTLVKPPKVVKHELEVVHMRMEGMAVPKHGQLDRAAHCKARKGLVLGESLEVEVDINRKRIGRIDHGVVKSVC